MKRSSPTNRVATMYEIAATVTTAVPTELKLTGNWPVDWLQAPGIRSIEIQCKLLANESLGSPLVALREGRGGRDRWFRQADLVVQCAGSAGGGSTLRPEEPKLILS